MKFINPKVDYAFKKIFGSQQSKDILISFLNAIIYNGEKTIKDLTIVNPFNTGKIISLKETYLALGVPTSNAIRAVEIMKIATVAIMTETNTGRKMFKGINSGSGAQCQDIAAAAASYFDLVIEALS